jgi:hypothetical protein
MAAGQGERATDLFDHLGGEVNPDHARRVVREPRPAQPCRVRASSSMRCDATCENGGVSMHGVLSVHPMGQTRQSK